LRALALPKQDWLAAAAPQMSKKDLLEYCARLGG
jgi:hypothetical protein